MSISIAEPNSLPQDVFDLEANASSRSPPSAYSQHQRSTAHSRTPQSHTPTSNSPRGLTPLNGSRNGSRRPSAARVFGSVSRNPSVFSPLDPEKYLNPNAYVDAPEPSDAIVSSEWPETIPEGSGSSSYPTTDSVSEDPRNASIFQSAMRKLSTWVDPDAELMRLPKGRRLRAFMAQEIHQDILLEIELLILTVATGILDSMTFIYYAVFVSKMTGNSILVGLASIQPSLFNGGYSNEANVGIALGLFFSGAAFFGHLGELLGQKRRGWLVATNFIQTGLVFGAAAIRFWGPRTTFGPHALGTIALLSFAHGGQIALALCVRMPELNTTMVTGAFVMLAVDRRIFAKKNPARNRRIAFFLSLILGSVIGSIAARWCDTALPILLTGCLKALVMVMFLFNTGVKPGRLPEGETQLARSSVTILKVLWGD
ncbi:hypothetical protein K402DRAFT_445502 [Aulographum hederae CBS 113979]|uniref:DUF1275 domain protein n=1 Tax=Aulographum hederae CBS 113979 TaxID=1176131 RepID=A0A6G1H4V4_9PEZI|nr:hypothetical protein K402DRAFT_445502 [Aulographum hederae CBS 113979]